MPKSDFAGLRALFLNCTLYRTPERSRTEMLIDVARTTMEAAGVGVSIIRPVDYVLADGLYPDMTQHGCAQDDWPALFAKVLASDILVLTTPVWLGARSSVCSRVIERLHGCAELAGQGPAGYAGRVGGCLVAGPEDGAGNAAMSVLYALQQLGFALPPQADTACLAPDGTIASGDEAVRARTVRMATNLMRLAWLLRSVEKKARKKPIEKKQVRG